MITYWRNHNALGLASIKIISDDIKQAQDYAVGYNLEFMTTFSARSLAEVIDIREKKDV